MGKINKSFSKKNIYAARVGVGGYISHHGQALVLSLKNICCTPFASLLTFSVIAFAIALPLLLWMLLVNTQTLIQGWQSTQMVVYFKKDARETEIQQVLHELQQNRLIKRAEFISAAQGLADFERHTGLTNIIAALQKNPLPDVIEIYPSQALLAEPEKVQLLVSELKSLPAIESIQLDMEWVQKMHAITLLAEQLVLMLAVLLGAGVLLIIVNTIRLTSYTARDEIRVIKLIGGSKAFICRPYVYMGLFYGLGGGALAIFAVNFALNTFTVAIQQLVALFHGNFVLQGFSDVLIARILVICALLGYCGAWLSVRSLLRNTEIH